MNLYKHAPATAIGDGQSFLLPTLTYFLPTDSFKANPRYIISFVNTSLSMWLSFSTFKGASREYFPSSHLPDPRSRSSSTTTRKWHLLYPSLCLARASVLCAHGQQFSHVSVTVDIVLTISLTIAWNQSKAGCGNWELQDTLREHIWLYSPRDAIFPLLFLSYCSTQKKAAVLLVEVWEY